MKSNKLHRNALLSSSKSVLGINVPLFFPSSVEESASCLLRLVIIYLVWELSGRDSADGTTIGKHRGILIHVHINMLFRPIREAGG
jgi:hypothetical protein